jgi:hypothetical protein
MDCLKLAELTGWKCRSAGVRSVRAISPITLGEDGQHAAFYIAQPSDTTFFLTDASETSMHAEHLGIEVSKSKFDALNKTCGVRFSKFDSEGSIVAEGPIEHLQFALWDAIKLAMALSFKTNSWRPKFDQTRFRDFVISELSAQIAMQRIITSAKVKGMSGHLFEFPIAVKLDSGDMCYVQPIALNNGSIDWPLIWQAHGKFFDLKALSDDNQRLAIVEDGAQPEDFGKAVTLLTHAAPVRTLRGTKDWAKVFC